MSELELVSIKGGAGISSTLLNVLIRALNTSLELGRTLGTVIRRSVGKNKC